MGTGCCKHQTGADVEHIGGMTEDELNKGLEQLMEWFPDEAPQLREYKHVVVVNLFRRTRPSPDAPVMQVKFASPTRGERHPDCSVEYWGESEAPEIRLLQTEKMTEEMTSEAQCITKILIFCVQVVFFALGLAGLKIFGQPKGIAKAVGKQLSDKSIHGLKQLVDKFNEAESALGKARALFGILDGFRNIGGVTAVVHEIANHMSFWDWVTTGVVAVAQITAWMATGGLAFIAKAALSVMSAVELIKAGDQVSKCC